MISCPSCHKDIADDSAHCGFCGAKIETGAGKKTMIGFAALTGDALKQAAEEARQARESAAHQSAPASEPPAVPAPPAPAAPASLAPQIDEVGPTDVDYKTPVAGTPAAVSMGPGGPVEETPASSAKTKAIETPEAFDSPGPEQPGGPSAKTAPEISVQVPDPTASATGSMELAQNTLPEKKRNPAVYVVGAIFALFALCCVLSLVWTFVAPMLAL